MSPAWEETVQCVVVVAGLVAAVALVGHFGSSCQVAREQRKQQLLTECMRAGKTTVECKLLEIAK